MKRITTLFIFALLLIPYHAVFAQKPVDKQTVSGRWLGNLDAGGISLRIVYNIKINDKDSLIATMDSPDQNASNIPMGRVIARNDSLIILAPQLMGRYTGAIISDTLVKGLWTQAGRKYSMDIIKIRKAIVSSRPQEPKPPFPYLSEDVVFANKKFNFMLAGTLTIPQGKGPFPAAILITGSGPQNRDEAIMGHKPFLIIADWLTRNGIAVLRYDDRGVAKSQGTYAGSTTADFATDAAAAFQYLRSRQEIKSDAIGLIGHSEGGLIAPMVAAENPDVAFIVSLSGPGVSGEEVILTQAADIGRLSGMSEQQIKDAREVNKELYSIVKKEPDDYKAEAAVLDAYRKILVSKQASEDKIEEGVSNLHSTFGAKTYPWFRYFISAEPSTYWKKVKCPVLALNGEKDLQVSAAVNLPAIEKAVRSSGNNNIKVVALPELNHLFQHCTTGLPSEYNKIDETFSPGALKIISEWILGLKK